MSKKGQDKIRNLLEMDYGKIFVELAHKAVSE
jgi:hypothetical protein